MTKTSFMFDTNIFDRVLDGKIDIAAIKSNKNLYATHIQLDELNAAPDLNRKGKLLKIFQQVVNSKVPTESMVWDVSKWDEGKWSSETQLTPTEAFVLGVSRLGKAKLGKADIYSLIKAELDKLKAKPNNIKDALLAETSVKNGYVLVSDDKNLRKVIKKIGGLVLTFEEFQQL